MRTIREVQDAAAAREAEAYAARLGRRLEREAQKQLRREFSRERCRVALEARAAAARLAGIPVSSLGSNCPKPYQ